MNVEKFCSETNRQKHYYRKDDTEFQEGYAYGIFKCGQEEEISDDYDPNGIVISREVKYFLLNHMNYKLADRFRFLLKEMDSGAKIGDHVRFDDPSYPCFEFSDEIRPSIDSTAKERKKNRDTGRNDPGRKKPQRTPAGLKTLMTMYMKRGDQAYVVEQERKKQEEAIIRNNKKL